MLEAVFAAYKLLRQWSQDIAKDERHAQMHRKSFRSAFLLRLPDN